jgi:glycosyltransferase EpsD
MSKILYAASTMSHINNFHLDYISALKSEGHEVLVMARGEGADFDIPFEKKIFSSKNTAARRKIKKILLSEGFDAVLLNTSLAAFHIRLAMPKKNRPRVTNLVHGYLFSKDTGFIKRKLFLLSEKLLKSKTDSVIVMNTEDEKIATENRLFLDKVYNTLGMGVKKREVDLENYKKIREKSGDKFVLSFVGELSGRKNQEMLISALPALKNKIGGLSLWLVGDGAELENLKALARELGVCENVRFFGQVPNPCDFISASDIYVSASKIEGLPFNIIEAMSCGKTVIISDIKGHSDIVSNGENGFLYPLSDVNSFVNAVLKCYNGVRLDEEKILQSFERYRFENVFPLTLNTIKESLGL